MLIILTLLIDLTDCYLTDTKLEISEVDSQLTLLLEPSNSQTCAQLPPGVKIQLIFSNQTLDVQKVITDFNYSTTTRITIEVPAIDEYFGIQLAQFRIKSYDLIYNHQLQEVIITKNDQLQVFDNFVINYDQTVFNANVSYPKTFPSMNVVNAWINITNFLQSYIIQYDGTPIINPATHTITLNCPNSEISPTLYANGIIDIKIHILYGNEIQTLGQAITNTLTYKNQPAPGESLQFRIFENTIYIKTAPSVYFIETVAKYPVVGILCSFNGGVCGFYQDYPSSSINDNIIENGGIFTSLMNQENFPNNVNPDDFSQDYQGCVDYAKLNGEVLDLSFVFLDESGVAQNRISFTFDVIQISDYVDGEISVGDGEIWIKAKQNVKVYSGNGVFKVKLFQTQKDVYFNDNEVVLNQSIEINGDIDVLLVNQDQKLLERIAAAYFIKIDLYDNKNNLIDDFQVIVTEDAQQKAIVYNSIVISICIIVSSVLGGCVILIKSKPAKKKFKAIKISNDDIS